jgi:nitric oxide reductase NorD protein
MPEAEDVLLHGALHATHAVRRVWRRLAAGDVASGRAKRAAVSLADERRRIALWLDFGFGRAFEIHACDPAPRAGWLARGLGARRPSAGASRAQAFSDGAALYLPRTLAAPADGGAPRTRLLLMALGQARRAARGSLAALPHDPVERDVFWALDGAACDAWIADRWPGLADALARERADALRHRPPVRALRGAERGVEALVRRLLRGAAGEGRALLVELGAPLCAEVGAIAPLARALASMFAGEERDLARRYRGVAPVPHQGVPRPDLVSAAASAAASGSGEPPAPGLPGRTLPRRVEAREADATELLARPGAFALAFGDPELSAQDPSGVQRPRDLGDEPDLDALAEAVAQPGGAARVRAPGPVRDVLAHESARAGAQALPAAPAAEEACELRFPEWDRRSGAYRREHCRVLVAPARRLDAASAERLIRDRAVLLERLRRSFETIRPRRARRPRELDGDELDLDGFVDDFADRCAGAAPAGRLYTTTRPRRRDVSVALLLDVSGSTDAQVHGSDRVIDVEKAAALCFGEALARLGDRHAVYAFSGHGPEGVRVRVLKRFDEPFGDRVRARIGGLEPESFTRLGATLRFATGELARERTRARLLLVLSDGKPYDEDEYAGEYGVADVRQAVAEAELADVHPYCVTVDREGPGYLGRMFGPGRFTLLWNVAQLPERLPEVYRRLTVGA